MGLWEKRIWKLDVLVEVSFESKFVVEFAVNYSVLSPFVLVFHIEGVVHL